MAGVRKKTRTQQPTERGKAGPGKTDDSARTQLAGFIAKYSPEIAAHGRAALPILRRQVPGAVELVYDNYQFLVVGFGPSERASEALQPSAADRSGPANRVATCADKRSGFS